MGIIFIAEVVEWLTLSTAVREVAGSILTEGMFSEKSISGYFSHLNTWIQGKPNTVYQGDYKWVSHVSLIPENVWCLCLFSWLVVFTTILPT